MQDRIASLLSSGLKPAQIATIIGISPGRISQITSTEEFSLKLQALQAEQKEVDIEEQAISAKYCAAEHALINQVMEMAPVSELRDVTAALRVVAERQEKMKSRTSILPHQSTQQINIVSITLPSHALAIPSIQQNSQKEVIAIDGNTLAPLSSQSVTNLFAALKKPFIREIKEGEQYEPSTSIISSEASFTKAASPAPCEASFLEYAGAGA